MTIAAAIFSRWNDTSLDTSIAKLYPGDDDAAPPGASMPRAQYSLGTETEQADDRSRGNRIKIQPVRFRIWTNDWLLTGTHLDSIEDEFVNSWRAGTNPLSIATSEGVVLDIDFDSKDRTKEEDDVFQGVIQFSIMWQKANAVPA